MKKETQAQSEILRQKASDLLEKKSKKASTKLEGEFHKLIHELQVHQVELELQNEELIRANENAEIATAKYTELYDFAPTGYFTLSKDGEIKELNIAGAKMLGKNRSELKNRMFGLYVSTGTKPAFNLFIAGIFTNMEQSTCEVTLTKNGTSQIDVNLTGIVTNEGDTCFVTAVDITERIRKEHLLRHSESQLAEIQIIANLGTYSFDIVADKWESSGMLDTIFGINPDFDKSLSGWTSIIHPDWQQEMTDYFNEEVIGKNIKFDKEYKIIRQNDKAECWVHGTGRLIFNDKNQPLIMLGSIRDITYSKQREEEINVKNAELLKLNAEKDKFFSIIAHDLRGPFGAIHSLTSVIAQNLSGMTLDELQKAMNLMYNSATNLNLLIGNLLEWSLLKRGITTFNPETFLLLPKIIENIALASEAASKKEITIDYDISEHLTVSADPNMFGGIMRNLVSNAFKFTPAGGNIQISAQSVPGNQVRVSVKDSGIGISKAMIGNMFRLGANTSRKGTAGELSTGLGLILCKDFIEKHGGVLEIESEEGIGTTFYFTLSTNAPTVGQTAVKPVVPDIELNVKSKN